MQNPAEKRRFERVSLTTPMRFQVRGSPAFDNSVLEDICVGGACFLSDKFIPVSTPLMLELNVLSRILHPIGKVAWTAALPRSGRNRIGIEFLELNQVEKNYLGDFITLKRSNF